VTCTNSPRDPQTSPLKNAGIDGWFERSFSVDRVRRFKPALQVYHMVAEELNVPPSAICMVAAHVWDTIGAQSIGCSGALIARPGNAPLPVHGLPQPQVVAAGSAKSRQPDDTALALISYGAALTAERRGRAIELAAFSRTLSFLGRCAIVSRPLSVTDSSAPFM
jgi:phosphoglycolate phosphatase-like HAD superfamily hydrolase